MPDPSPVNEIFERKVASSCCYEYPVKNKNEMQGAKQVLTKKHKMVSIPYVLEMYGDEPNVHKNIQIQFICIIRISRVNVED